MASQRVRISLAYVIAMAIITPPPLVDAFSHIVGGSLGWAVPPNASYYDEWAASPRVFGIGDKLVFPYRPGQYNVYQVNQNDFENCTQIAPISQYAKGPTIYYLSKKGDYYFYCGIAKHCELGTKLHITVTSDTEGTSGDRFSFELGSESSDAPAPAPGIIDEHKDESSAEYLSPVLVLCVVSAIVGLVLVW